MSCNAMKHILGVFTAQRLVIACIRITRNKLYMSCNAMKHILVFSFHCTEVSYCVHMHNEKEVGYVMQCTETHLRCFLFTAQELVIACICITRNKLDISCNALKHMLGVFFSLHRG